MDLTDPKAHGTWHYEILLIPILGPIILVVAMFLHMHIHSSSQAYQSRCGTGGDDKYICWEFNLE
jgi:hypothetical protein